MNVDTFLYREESTWIKVRFRGEMVWYLFTETSCLILVKEKLYYYLLVERQNVNKKEKR